MAQYETPPIIKTRERTHGVWKARADLSQSLKRLIFDRLEENLTASQTEAIEMICVKISRIIYGDPAFKDHWADIAGYAKLGGNLDD